MYERPLNLKTIGIMGGTSNVATAEYYTFLNDGINQRLGGWEIAETLVMGMNFGNIRGFLDHDDWDGIQQYMSGKVDALIAGGADVIIGVSNTLHRVLEPIMADAQVPFIHIAEPTGAAIKSQGLSKVALFGTKPVMELDYIKARHKERYGIDAISPTEAEQVEIDQIIFDELVKGVINPASKARYLEIAKRMREEEGVEGLILGCTEIFLLIDQPDMPDFPMFNTAKLHCDAAIEFALQDVKAG